MENTIRQFRSRFIGYTESFVQHVPPFKNDGNKTTATSVRYAKTGKNGTFTPLKTKDYEDHLGGKVGLAISPLFSMRDADSGETVEDVCLYGIIDIDIYSMHYTALIKALRRAGYIFAPFTSKSGGLHLYFFFSSIEKAEDVRSALKVLVERFGLDRRFAKNGASKVEIFPEHSSRRSGLQDKCVFLPYFKGDMTHMIGDDGDPLTVERMLEETSSLMTSVQSITKISLGLEHNEAPFCIQSILLNGDLGESSGRNEFLTTAAIYLQTKDGQGARVQDLHDMNVMLEDPLSEEDVQTIFDSVMARSYVLAGRCNKEPMVSNCDKTRCKTRKYGVGREKDNYVLNVEFGKLYKMKAEEPYYLWEAKFAGSEKESSKIRLDDTGELMNQKAVQKACIKGMGQMMVTVKPSVWEATLNKHLADMEEQEVSAYTDTSELSALRDYFYRYLTNRRAKNNQAYTVLVKQVYYDGASYYFRTDGLTDFLRTQRFTLRMNLREYLFKYGCREGVLQYITGSGEVKDIPCWIKDDDEQLLGMRDHFEDVLGSDERLIEDNPVSKDKKVFAGDDDVRF